MWNATIKGLLSHKLRLALTALAIVLGVSFVSGTYVLTDTMNATFTQLFKDTTKGIDVVVQTRQTFSGEQGDTRDPVPESLLPRIRGIDGVKVAEGSVNGFAQCIGKNGKAVTTGGAPTLGVSASEAPELNSNFTIRSGRVPSSPNEVAVDARTASKQGFKVGDQVKVLSQGPTRSYAVSGIVGFGQADNLAGATLAVFDLKTAQQVLDSQGKFNEIDVVAQPGVTSDQLRERIAAAVPSRYESITGADQAQRSSKEIQKGLGFFSTALLAFAGVALFVGAFLIFNTFSIIVAQRTRELALLRCLGASRRQVLSSVLLESGLVGLVASAIGLGCGVLIALGLRGVLGAVGIDLPSTGTVFEVRTVIVSLVVGVVITLVSSFMPALKATRVPPVAAMRAEAAMPRSRSIRRRSIIGSVVTLIGVGLLVLGLFRDIHTRIAVVGAGALVIRHGRRADDRPGAGDLRRYLRGLGQGVDRRRARPDGVRRLHRDPPELPGLQPRGGQAPCHRAAAAGGHLEPLRRLEAERHVAEPAGCRPRRLRQHGPHRGHLGQHRGPAERRPGRVRGRRQAARLEGRQHRADAVPGRRGPAGAAEGHLQGQPAQRRLSAVADRLPEGLQHPARLDGDRQGEAWHQPRHGARRHRQGGRRLPERPDPGHGPVQGADRQAARSVAQPGPQPAGVRDPDRAVRDREHPGAVGVRAGPRAGPAARGRRDPAPGAVDDPLGGGDHLGPRRGSRHGGRRVLRLDHGAGAGLAGVR